MRYISFLLFVLVTISGCSKNEEPAADIKMSLVKLPPKKESYSSVDAKTEIAEKIIKEASLQFETDNLEDTFNLIQNAVKANKAKIQNDSETKSNERITRNLTIRIPSQNFDSFLNTISKGVFYFERKNISSRNVTEEYIDLTSRLKNKRKLEERYLEILQKVTKISEILEIEKQISVIREEIEAKEGQLKYLENQVSESTIYIEFYKTIAQKEGVKTSYTSKIWTAFKSGFFSLSDFLISIISLWPFIILIGVITYFIRKRFKRKKL